MDSLNAFKKIADEVMQDIIISDELTEKTLQRCRNKKIKSIKTGLIPAACIMVFLISIASWRFLFYKEGTPNAYIMRAPNNTTLPAPKNGNQIMLKRTTISTEFKNLDEAKKFIDNKVLEPSYIPDRFELRRIQGVSYEDDKKRSVWIEYVSGDKSFQVSVEERSEWKSFEGYEDIDINGLKGHMKYLKDDNSEITEVRWFSDKDLYTVEGAISQVEALKLARSLR